MKRRLINPIAAVAALAFTFFGCASSDNQTGSTAMNTATTTETQAVTGTDTGTESTVEGDFNMQFEAETSTGGLVLTDEVAYNDMFEEIEDTESLSILELAETSSNLSTFMHLMRSSGTLAALEAEGSWTLFAPTNEAFAALPAGRLEYLMKPENKAELIDLLNAHILRSEVGVGQLNSNHRISLEDGRMIPISVDQTGVTIGGATVVKSNVEASNGVIHVVDAVITPTENTGGPYGR